MWADYRQFAMDVAGAVRGPKQRFNCVRRVLIRCCPLSNADASDAICGGKREGVGLEHETPPNPASVSGVEAEASALVMKCLQKNPKSRFRDFDELRQAIEMWVTTKGWLSIIPSTIALDEAKSEMTATDWLNRGYALGQLGRTEDSYRAISKQRN